MVVWFFTGSCMSGLLFSQMPPDLHFNDWDDGYQEVLPYLQSAFSCAVEKVTTQIDLSVREELTQVIVELCNPNPEERGHPKARSSIGSSYSLERYVSVFDRLATRSLIRGL